LLERHVAIGVAMDQQYGQRQFTMLATGDDSKASSRASLMSGSDELRMERAG
jgi:hypothetical protein